MRSASGLWRHSIYNTPILNAFGRRGKLRFVPARGEAGAVSMADAYARVTARLGVGITSTGEALRRLEKGSLPVMDVVQRAIPGRAGKVSVQA